MTATIDVRDVVAEPEAAAEDLDPGPVDIEVLEPEPVEFVDLEYDLCVRLLGSIDVEGSPAKLSEQQVAVLASLSTHREATKGDIIEALWRDDQPSKARLSNLLYQTRRTVGSNALPAAADRTNLLGDRVVSDLDLFDHRVKVAATLPAPAAMRVLEDALNLVRGPVLTYTNRAARFYSWVDLENYTSIWERKVADVAHRLSEQHREDGDPEAAAQAALAGLKAIPLNDALVCDLFLALEGAGDFRAVERSYDEHARALERLGFGEPSRSVTDLFDDIAGRVVEPDRT